MSKSILPCEFKIYLSVHVCTIRGGTSLEFGIRTNSNGCSICLPVHTTMRMYSDKACMYIYTHRAPVYRTVLRTFHAMYHGMQCCAEYGRTVSTVRSTCQCSALSTANTGTSLYVQLRVHSSLSVSRMTSRFRTVPGRGLRVRSFSQS